MCIAIIIINTDFEIVRLPVVDPTRQLFPWIHRGNGQHKQHIPTTRMYEPDNIKISAKASTP
jgi:RPA family protein